MTKTEVTGCIISEEWMPVKGYEGKYEISNYGNLKYLSKDKRKVKFMKKQMSKGYVRYFLSKDGTQKRIFAHRLVAMHFLPTPKIDEIIVNHKDGNPGNNFYKNLEWCTYSYNRKHYFDELDGSHWLHRNIEMSKDGVTYQFKSFREAAKELKMSQTRLGNAFRSGLNFYRGYAIKISDTKVMNSIVANTNPPIKITEQMRIYHETGKGGRNSKKIQVEGNGINKVFNSVTEACQELGLNLKSVYDAMYQKRNMRKYKLKYV